MINLPIILFVGICTAVLVLSYISFVQVRRADKAETIATQLVDRLQEISNYIYDADESLNQNPQVRAAFESDDEVGDFFQQLENIKDVLKSLSI